MQNSWSRFQQWVDIRSHMAQSSSRKPEQETTSVQPEHGIRPILEFDTAKRRRHNNV